MIWKLAVIVMTQEKGDVYDTIDSLLKSNHNTRASLRHFFFKLEFQYDKKETCWISVFDSIYKCNLNACDIMKKGRIYY